MELLTSPLFILPCVALIFIGIIVMAWLAAKPRGVLTRAEPGPGEWFEMVAAPDDGRTYRLLLQYDISYRMRKHEDEYGLVCELKGSVAGRPVIDERLGIGTMLPDGVRMIRLEMNPTEVSRFDDYDRRATVELAALGPRGRGNEIKIRGRIVPHEETTVHSLKLFLSR